MTILLRPVAMTWSVSTLALWVLCGLACVVALRTSAPLVGVLAALVPVLLYILWDCGWMWAWLCTAI